MLAAVEGYYDGATIRLPEDFHAKTNQKVIVTLMNEFVTPDATEKDPFYSESNLRHLENIVKDIKAGKAHFAEHDLIEVE